MKPAIGLPRLSIYSGRIGPSGGRDGLYPRNKRVFRATSGPERLEPCRAAERPEPEAELAPPNGEDDAWNRRAEGWLALQECIQRGDCPNHRETLGRLENCKEENQPMRQKSGTQ